jgi:hypothetical protein
MEVKADRRDLPEDTKVLQTITLRDLVRRYRDEVTVLKKGRETETEFLNAFLRHTICARSISELAGLRGVSRRAAHEDRLMGSLRFPDKISSRSLVQAQQKQLTLPCGPQAGRILSQTSVWR